MNTQKKVSNLFLSTCLDCISMIFSNEHIFVNAWHSWGLPTESREAVHRQRRKFLWNHQYNFKLSSSRSYNVVLCSTWSQAPEQQRAKSWTQSTSQGTQRTENTHHRPLCMISEIMPSGGNMDCWPFDDPLHIEKPDCSTWAQQKQWRWHRGRGPNIWRGKNRWGWNLIARGV